MTFCRKTIWLLVAVAALLPAGCASQRGRMASKRDVNTAQLLAAARQYEKEGNLQSAAGIYRHVLQFQPGNAEAREGLALVQQGKLRVDHDPQQLLALNDSSTSQKPQARQPSAKVRQQQREQVNERMAELIAQAARNPTKVDVDPTPAQMIVAAADARPVPSKSADSTPVPTAGSTPAAPHSPAPHSPAPPKPLAVAETTPPAEIAQVAAVAVPGRTSTVETADFPRPEPDAKAEDVPTDWTDGGWKGHSLTDKCRDASAAVLTEVRKLENKADATRKEGLTKLALMGPEAISAVPAIRHLLNDQNQLVCAHAAWAVWEIEGDAQTALEVLQQSLTSKSAHVVQFACYSLGRLGEFARPTAPTLQMLLGDKNAYVQLHAAEALTRVCEGDEAANAMDTLILLLKDADAGVRMLAATSLGRVDAANAETAIAVLTAALDDEDAGVRSAAALSLGAFGSAADSAVARLEEVVANDQTGVRDAATTALACIKL